MTLLRLLTPEEISQLSTKNNGGKFLALTELMQERVEHNILRDFSDPDVMEQIHEEREQLAKILPFKKEIEGELKIETEEMASSLIDNIEIATSAKAVIEHSEDENMSSFIMIEKARLKKSQEILKQKEIVDLYKKNIGVEVEQIRTSNKEEGAGGSQGKLVNKRHY